ncbi:hypothetical protein GW17_00008585 [Ensete ventricosum]|nr:hypothetical protein GW17_00008585 [Ensete ventricosum]
MASLSVTRRNSSASLLLFILQCFLSFFISSDAQQLAPSQSGTLLRLQRLLEYPQVLAGWSSATAFCSLPTSLSLSVACSGDRIVELVIVGDRPASPRARNALSLAFSSDSLFTTLSRLPSLTTISLVALGLWGSLPGKVDRFPSLKTLNLSSNYFAGAIPVEISTMSSLQNLVLSGNSFNGSIPDLKSLTALVELNVGRNQLGPDFPSLSSNLVTLVLKDNSFRGKIPASVASFHQLQKLDLSSNRLAGWIPPSLFSLRSIQYLDLSHNTFTGEIPSNASCGDELGFVDITDNHLVGGLPSCLRSNTSTRVVLSSGNCLNAGDLRHQHSEAYCSDAAFAAVLPPANKISGSKSNVGVILGITGGVVVGAALLVLLVFLAFGRARVEEPQAIALPKPVATKSLSQDSTRTPAEAVLMLSVAVEWRKREMLKWPQRLAAVTGIARGIQFLHTAAVPDSPSDLKGIADPSIRGTYAVDSLRTAIEISLNCASRDPNQRPSIDDVLWNLQYSAQIQDGWASSENLSIQV